MSFTLIFCVVFYVDCRSVPTYYSWQSPNGFSIVPKDGLLAPKETCRHSATFCPQTARVYDDFTTCTYSNKTILSDNEEDKVKDSVFTKVMKVEGVGKYPYVVVKRCLESRDQATTTAANYEDLVVDFGSVAVGNSADKCVLLNNPSPVSNVYYSIIRAIQLGIIQQSKAERLTLHGVHMECSMLYLHNVLSPPIVKFYVIIITSR